MPANSAFQGDERIRTAVTAPSTSYTYDALDWLNAARAAWERTSDQLTIDLHSSDPSGGASDVAPDTLHSLSAPRTGGSTPGEGSETPCATTSTGPFAKSGPTASPATDKGFPQPPTHREGRAQDPNTTTVAANTQARESAATVRREV